MKRIMLEEFLSKKEEISELRDKLDDLERNKIEESYVSDVIMDYRKGYPQPQAITGIDYTRISRLRSKYTMQIMRLQEECDLVEEYIDTINDSMTRRIIRMYFCEGATQQQIAKKIHLDQSVISRKISKILNSI